MFERIELQVLLKRINEPKMEEFLKINPVDLF